ncbi:MAG: hypothetical protein ACYC3X_18955 [Pirellulaceae bacterium]
MIDQTKSAVACALILLACVTATSLADEHSAKLDSLPALTDELSAPVKGDWLIAPAKRKTGVYRCGAADITLTNGLVRRTWRIAPNAATVGFENLMTGAAVIRGVKPEAILELDGAKYSVGGLVGQPQYAYLRPAWIDALKNDPAAFQFVGFEIGQPQERFAWKRKPYSADLPWPPPGASLTLNFQPPPEKFPGLLVSVCYEVYDGIPLVCKWTIIRNGGQQPVKLNTFVNEILAAVEHETTGLVRQGWDLPNIHVESDYAMNGATPLEADITTHWVVDPQYTTQRWRTPSLMESRLPLGPDAVIAPGDTFETFRTFELIYDSTERERKGLALRRMYRTIAPWVTENPITMDLLPADPATVRRVTDQCAEVGFEMLGLTFGSGFDIENEDPAYIAQIKDLTDYANSKGVELGGYSLLASRSVGPEHDVIDRNTGKPGGATYGNMPCLGSQWGEDYLRKVRTIMERTGLSLLEHDGSYPGDLCASTSHAGHRGLADSQWVQWKKITELYRWARGRGIYLSVPDWFFLNGSSKVFLGYCEENWTLPRDEQVILSRQNIYDGTWQKTPSMGWSFLPLVNYKGGGAAALIEPLSEHLDAYEAHLAQNLGSGIQCQYRGSRLYDTDATKAVVKKWVDFYKKYRPVLDSDIIHVRRPDARDIDCMMHVNPQLQQKGLAMVFNPLDRSVTKTLKLPLYYTGLTDTASIRREEGQPVTYVLDRQYNVEVPIEMGPKSVTWFVIE